MGHVKEKNPPKLWYQITITLVLIGLCFLSIWDLAGTLVKYGY